MKNKKGLYKIILNFVLKYGIYFIFLVLCIIASIATPRFLLIGNLSNVLLQTSAVGIIAIGMTYVIITGGIDVSVGSSVALASAVGVTAMKLYGQPWWIALILIFLVSGIIGLVNGFSIAYIKMPPFLATLGTLTVARGLVLVISKGRNYWGLHPFYERLGLGLVGPIPTPAIVMLSAFIVGHIILSKTVFGRKIYAIGGNPDTAKVSGLNVELLTLSAYVVMGFFCGLSSMVLTSRLNSFVPTMGTGFEFSAIAATVIGGTSLQGGEGNIIGTLIGVLILGVVNNILNLLGVSVYYQEVSRGLIIFIAVLVDALRNRFAKAID
jgi:ribose/xylose/arabinose/galactoside ABC-type transport system permease subunit